MDLSIAIVSWNTRDLLDQCIKSVCEATSCISYEIIVVDNGSSDGTVDMLRSEYPQVKLVQNDYNAGFARANNQAFRISEGRYFLLLNSDTITRPGALQEMVRWMDGHPDCGICGCMLLNADGSLQPSWAAVPGIISEARGKFDRTVGGKDLSLLSPLELREVGPFNVGWVGGACLMIRRSVAETVGLMDEGYFMYCEELDWCWRVGRAGYKVTYLPMPQVIHLGGGSSRLVRMRSMVRQEYSRMRFLWKSGRVNRIFMLPFAMLTAVKLVYRTLREVCRR